MARPKKRFQQLIEEIDRTPWGPAEQALVAEAVALAVEIGDERLEYDARMRQTASANMNGATDVMLNSFAWCLAHHDAEPQRFPADLDNGGADLMWQFKWMASSLRSSPAFSQEQIAAVLDDMETHYRAAGLGASGVLTARFEDAWDARPKRCECSWRPPRATTTATATRADAARSPASSPTPTATRRRSSWSRR